MLVAIYTQQQVTHTGVKEAYNKWGRGDLTSNLPPQKMKMGGNLVISICEKSCRLLAPEFGSTNHITE